MLNKFLLISLGGSGEKLARYLKQDLEQRLRIGGWEAGIPLAYRWLCLDVAHNTDVVIKGMPADLGEERGNGTRVGLAEDDLRYTHYLDQLTSNPNALKGLAGALPGNVAQLPPPFKGAGQRPQVGNVVGLAGLAKLKAEIERQMVRLNGDGVSEELKSLSAKLKPDYDRASPGTTVLVASSLGGGSGAGLLQLVMELVLNTVGNDPEVEVATVLFTPDIFYDLTDIEKQGVQANCLYTVSSLLNGYHGAGERSAVLADLLSAGGVELSDRRRAAVTNFFIGRGNGEFDFEHQNVAIKAAAQAIGRLLVDETVVNGLNAHLKTNGEGASVTDSYRIVPPLDLSRAASSFGYASVSLGGPQLADYAAERLAKLQLETFLRGHRSQRAPKESDDATIERIVAEELPTFLARVRLREEDVLKDLYDREELKREVKARAEEVTDSIRDRNRRDAPKRWLNHIERSYKAYDEEFAAKRAELGALHPAKWSQAVQVALREATIESIGRHGAPVVVALLEAVAKSMPAVAEELRRERNERLEVESEEFVAQARRALQEVKDQTLPNTAEAVGRSVDARGKASFIAEDSAYRKMAADLLSGLAEGVVEPLRICVAAAIGTIAADERERHAKMVESWPDSELPPRMQPAPNQRLLTPIEEFPEMFRELLEETTGELFDDAREKAAAELLTGSWSADPERRDLILADRAWRHGSVTPARFHLRLEIPDFVRRSEEWVRGRPGALADRVALSIADWIKAKPGRGEIFADGFEQALRRAAPLAEISAGVHLRVHGSTPEKPKLHVGTIPISTEDELYGRIAKSLKGAVADGELNDLFDGTSSASTIEFSCFLAQQVEPVVVAGLFRPIGDDWKGRVNDSMRQQFSAYRRTRPLPLFVPLTPLAQQRFVCGWIVAELLELFSEFDRSWDHSPLSVWTPEGWLGFPGHLLGGDVTDEDEVLGRVLESLPLALVSYAMERYEELEAYMRVLDLGDLAALRRWVETGVVESEGEVPLAAASGPAPENPAGDTPEARRQQLLERVERMRRETESYLAENPIRQGTVTALSPRWEVAGLRISALEQVRGRLVELSLHRLDGDAPADRAPLAT